VNPGLTDPDPAELCRIDLSRILFEDDEIRVLPVLEAAGLAAGRGLFFLPNLAGGLSFTKTIFFSGVSSALQSEGALLPTVVLVTGEGRAP
jgi:hypothetical protein